MAQYTSRHTGSQLDTVVTDVLSKSEKWTSKQDALVSGTNIKTINNNSILGGGNLTIETGKIDDVQINGTSVVANKIANIVIEQSYNAASTNAQSGVAVASAIKSAITDVINADY